MMSLSVFDSFTTNCVDMLLVTTLTNRLLRHKHDVSNSVDCPSTIALHCCDITALLHWTL